MIRCETLYVNSRLFQCTYHVQQFLPFL